MSSLATEPNPDDVVTEDVLQDPEQANYPAMASGNNCAKNWDSALLSNCTNERMKVIANTLDVSVASRMRKHLLYRAIYDAMTNDQACPQCPGGDCDPNTHLFAPTEQPPPGWIMGDANIYVEPTPPPPASSAPTSTVTSSAASVSVTTQQQLSLTQTLHTSQQQLAAWQNAGTSQQPLNPIYTQSGLRGPTPNSSLQNKIACNFISKMAIVNSPTV